MIHLADNGAKGTTMKTLIRLGLVLMSPYLVFVYWRNTTREMGNLHARYEIQFE